MTDHNTPASNWPAADPEAVYCKTEALSGLDTLIHSEYGNTGAIIIVKNGNLIYESYYNGYSPVDPFHVASVTKSILSAVVGIALERGLLKSIDQKVPDFFPEYPTAGADRHKREVTVRHLLTMTAPYSYEQEPFQELCMSPDWTAFALDLLGGSEAPGAFRYSTAGAHLLSAIVTRCTGKNACEFANEFLFGPAGMKLLPNLSITAADCEAFLYGRPESGWVTDPAGNSAGGWGLTLIPRDMARFGLLYLNRGRSGGRQIISEKWIDDSTAMNPNHYGYLWWLPEVGPRAARSFAALGDGGNVIYCLPEKELVVVIASQFMMNPGDRLALIQNVILPAV